jgi:hypothetical protein
LTHGVIVDLQMPLLWIIIKFSQIDKTGVLILHAFVH